MVETVFAAQVVSTLYMTGLIWFVQIVHYPLMSDVGKTEFAAYELRHQTLTSWVVGPPMLVELATALLMIWFRPATLPVSAVWTGLALLALIWISTALLQVPLHARLGERFDESTHGRLVLTNWIRTIAWSLRAAILFCAIAGVWI